VKSRSSKNEVFIIINFSGAEIFHYVECGITKISYVTLIHTNLTKFITPTLQAEYGMMRLASASRIHPDYPFRMGVVGIFSSHPSITDNAVRLQ